MPRLFLDSTVIISAITARNPAAVYLLMDDDFERYTNEYVIKETRRILQKAFDFSIRDVNDSIDLVRRQCIVLPLPNKEEYKKLEIKDASDKPIVLSAIKKRCILVTEDYILLENAKKYVKAKRPENL